MPDRSRPLAGLVSQDAEALFLRMLASGHAPADTRAPAAAELLDLGLAVYSSSGATLRPVDQAAALRLLLERRQHELLEQQRRVLDGWTRLTSLLPRDLGGRVCEGVVPLESFDEVAARTAELYPSAKQHVRGTETGDGPGIINEVRGQARAARFRIIYPVTCVATPAGARIIEDSAASGRQVRLRRDIPMKMLHVDDEVALISGARSTGYLVQTPSIVSVLAEWFDLMWADAATIAPGGGDEPALTPAQRTVLRLMFAGDDAAIARKLALSTTTVRRHVKAIYQVLGVNSRFAAGVAAAKRGWI
ncbi:helix-turn-helix transcriptional regulator [Lentzea guizhouensis]|uniref:helix-turn-helix transcriptional regulator n=1 Tax=Lentzea guizhouensis TaxID=1586287 RepID=UPI0012B6894B|nr:helix-turn-helix transcriptional regulator [Lentzea guizhouensis]